LKQVNIKVALVGNPNAGKSTLFNELTGLRQKTGNFPGVTVEKKSGTFRINAQNGM
jgi:ferrous iron transport protein B